MPSILLRYNQVNTLIKCSDTIHQLYARHPFSWHISPTLNGSQEFRRTEFRQNVLCNSKCAKIYFVTLFADIPDLKSITLFVRLKVKHGFYLKMISVTLIYNLSYKYVNYSYKLYNRLVFTRIYIYKSVHRAS